MYVCMREESCAAKYVQCVVLHLLGLSLEEESPRRLFCLSLRALSF